VEAFEDAPLAVGDGEDSVGVLSGLAGRFLAAEIRVGAGADTLVASPNFSAQAPGTTTFDDAQGNTWTLGTDAEITDRDFRFFGEVSQWPQANGLAPADRTVHVTAYGSRRRLELPDAPEESALVRNFGPLSGRSDVVAYWPMESGSDAQGLISAIPGHPAMRVVGEADMGSYSWPASGPLPVARAASFLGHIPDYTKTQPHAFVEFLLHVQELPSTNTNLISIFTDDGLWDIDLNNLDELRIRYLDRAEDTVRLDSGQINAGTLGTRLWVVVTLVQNGSSIDVGMLAFVLDDELETGLGTSVGYYSGSVSGQVSKVRVVTLARGKALGGSAVGHLVVRQTDEQFAQPVTRAAIAWVGEDPSERLRRLSVEEDVPIRMQTVGRFTATGLLRMGYQRIASWLDLVDEVPATDLGVLLEPRDTLGFAYRPHAEITGLHPALTLDYASGQIAGVLRPVDDDETLVNDVTVTRPEGGAARAENSDSIEREGRYRSEVEVSQQYDHPLAQLAGFRVRLGTVDEERYPTLDVDLHSPYVSDEQRRALMRLELGDRIDLLNVEPWSTDVATAQQVVGYTEELQLTTHRLTFSLEPGSPWIAHDLEGADDRAARVDTGGSVLAADLVSEEPEEPDPLGLPVVSWSGAGVADGALSTSTAGIGDTALDAVLPVSDVWSVEDERIRMDQPVGGGCYVAWQSGTLGTTRTRYGVRFTVEFTSWPSVGARFCAAHTASNATEWMLDMTSAGIIRLRDGASTTLDQSSAAAPVDTLMRFDCLALDGNVTVTIYVDDTEWDTLTATGLDAPLEQVRFGNPASAPTWPTLWYSHLSVTDPDATPPPAGGMLVTTVTGPRWVDSAAFPDSFPFDVMVGGERMTVTAIDGTGTTQTFTVTRGVNGVERDHPAGEPVTLAEPTYLAL